MNVYDFDDTIYRGDSTVDFYKFCIKKKPSVILKFPFLTGILFMLGLCKKVVFKERFYRFLTCFDNIDRIVGEFWIEHIKNIKPWYRKRFKPNDVVISASPEFLLEPLCKALGISRLIASVVDKHTGKYSGENCWGEEKVRRFRQVFGSETIDEFYSDSLSDSPLASISRSAYVITGDKTTPWNNYKLPPVKMLKKTFFSARFLIFVIIGAVNTLNCIWISYLIAKRFDARLAYIIGYAVSLVIGYLLNSVLNFHEKPDFIRLVKYSVSYIPNFVIQYTAVLIFCSLLKLPEATAYAAAGIIGIPVTFLCVKFFAFAKKDKKEHEKSR